MGIVVLYNQVEKQSVIAPLCLGLSSLAVSSVSATLGFPLGAFAAELLLFLAPLAYGFRGAILVTAVGLAPWAINTGDLQTGSRLSILIFAVAVCQRILPSVPGYVVTLLAWLACVCPTLSFLNSFVAPPPQTPREPMIMSLLQDVLVAALAGSLLFNEPLWWRLTRRVRYLQPHSLIPHLMAATALTSIFVVAVALRQTGLLASTVQTSADMGLGTLIVATFVLVPTVAGIHISRSLAATHSLLSANGSNSPLDTASNEPTSWLQQPDENWELIESRTAGDGAAALRSEESLALQIGVCAIDGNGSILFMNDNFRRLVELSDPTPVGAAFEPLGASSSLAQYIWQLVANTDPAQEHSEELRVSGRTDNVKFLQIHLCSHQLSDPPTEAEESVRPPRVVRVSDITNKRTIDDHLSRIQRHKALSACARAAAPQLSELFTAILGRASHAAHASSPAAQAAALRQIETLCAQGAPLVQQLNELGVPQEEAERHTVDLAVAVRERLPLLRGLAPNASFDPGPKPSAPLGVRLDSALLTQALSLVVLNAAEAYEDGAGKISVSVAAEDIDEFVSKLHPGSRPGKFARIRISDHGRGMPAEVLARVANPLLTVRGEYGHIGLDLPSVLAVMSEHDGFMTVESKPEKGTTVSLYFPISPEAPRTEEAQRPVPLASGKNLTANTNVMIVEDSPELRALLIDMVSSLGYRPIECDSKASALRLLQSSPVDILLVEESLPGLDARELLCQVHASGPAVKTVLLSAARNSSAQESDAVLLKPFGLEQLSRTLAPQQE